MKGPKVRVPRKIDPENCTITWQFPSHWATQLTQNPHQFPGVDWVHDAPESKELFEQYNFHSAPTGKNGGKLVCHVTVWVDGLVKRETTEKVTFVSGAAELDENSITVAHMKIAHSQDKRVEVRIRLPDPPVRRRMAAERLSFATAIPTATIEPSTPSPFAPTIAVAASSGAESLLKWLPERLQRPDTGQMLQATACTQLREVDDHTLKANVEFLLARMGRLAGELDTEPLAPEPAVHDQLVLMLRAFDFEPDDLTLLEQRDLSEPEDTLSIPPGVRVPERSETTVSRFARDPDVARTVRRLANGTCECCQGAAPFRDSSGVPFLEVHHIVRLADGGEDTVENAAAVCPNCHRELHHGAERNEKVKVLRSNIAKRRTP
jgi:hypothetical protein